MKKGNPIIDKRIKYFESRKSELLQMKKSERGDELKKVDQIISRLKKWNLELNRKESEKTLTKASERMRKTVNQS